MKAIQQQILQGNYIIVPRGVLDAAASAELKQAVETAIAQNVKQIWVDCEYLERVSVEALRTILYLSSITQDAGTKMLLYNINPAIEAAIKAAGLDKILHVVPTMKEAYLYGRRHS
ncbi:anti-anti-sigma factor [Pontibacter ummariensis]|uniref:Anti-anti-sigma factor n=1 Tax=Pontibacter ummariensis TaxID=1610492 RepID=A0A239KY11_9BACT|nr:STAS domain-containing protein [Pontibacter ummariensis]PRY04678.1 anti-anti-sigma factor [Pontibacter ummariensis]SNT22935.1 anti-anti-sigma factor [Pontibacter ummariensis]